MTSKNRPKPPMGESGAKSNPPRPRSSYSTPQEGLVSNVVCAIGIVSALQGFRRIEHTIMAAPRISTKIKGTFRPMYV